MRRLAAGLVLGSAITILAAGGWTSAAAQGDAGGQALTAGQLILVAGTPDGAMLSGLREALASDQAPMRALAAQLIGASRILALQRELIAAASREAVGDGRQASLLRALLLLDTPETRLVVEQQVAAGTPRARLAWAAWLARTSPAGLADALPALAQGLDAGDSWWLIQHVQRASIRGPGTGPALHAALLATLGRSVPRRRARARPGSSPRPPRRSYPSGPQVQGIVVIQSTIDPSGCVQSGRVLSGPSTALALAALEAVLQWRYTPTLLDGQPVSVLMTVTVNFTLN